MVCPSRMKDVPTAITKAAPMIMCWSSFMLNLNPFLGIIGEKVMVCWYAPCTGVVACVSCGAFLALQISGQLWFSGILCAGQK